jgi:hypothetical protein
MNPHRRDKQSLEDEPIRVLRFLEVFSMQTSRREFFEAAAIGGVAATVSGFDLQPAYGLKRQALPLLPPASAKCSIELHETLIFVPSCLSESEFGSKQ